MKIPENKKYAVAVIGLVMFIAVGGFFVLTGDNIVNNEEKPSNTNTTLNQTQKESLSNYEGLYVQGDNLKVDSEILIDNHIKSINNLGSYEMYSSSTRERTEKTIKKEGNLQTVVINRDGGRDSRVYSDGDFVYRRIGSPINTLRYSTTSGEIDIKDYYEYKKIKSILSNSKASSFTENSDSIDIKMNISDSKKITDTLNSDKVNNFNLTMTVREDGVIPSYKLNYDSVINNYTSSYKSYNYIRNINSTDVEEPDWIDQSTKSDPLVEASYDSSKLKITNNGLGDIDQGSELVIYEAEDSSMSKSLNEKLKSGDSLYITSINNDKIETTRNSSVSGNVKKNNIYRVVIRDEIKNIFDYTP